MKNENFKLSKTSLDHINSPKEDVLTQKPTTFLTAQENFWQIGVLGIFFGLDRIRSIFNMAFVVFLCAILSGIIFINKCPPEKLELANDFWTVITPVITMSIGFLFGKK